MKQDRFLLGILAGIAILIVLALALFFLRRDRVGYVEGDTPEAVLHNYVVAIEEQDFDRAYGYVAESDSAPSYDAFRGAMISGRPGRDQAGLEIGAAQIDGDEALVPVTVVRVGGGPLADTYREPLTAALERQDGEWRIASMAYPYWDWSWQPQSGAPEKPLPVEP